LRRGTESTVVLVRPFADLSERRDQAFFADGLTEELITALARVPGLRVVARTTAFQLTHPPGGVADVARQLGVAAVIEGSVRRHEGRVRVTAQLVDARDGCSLWSGAYERQEADLLDLQQQLSLAITAALRVELESVGTLPKAAFDVEAHELFLQGRALFNQWTVESVRHSVPLFEQAMARAPQYVPAHFGLADSACFLAYHGVDTDANVARSRRAIDQTLRLDSTYGEVYVPLAVLRAFYDWDWRGAERAFHAALALCPGSAMVRHLYGICCLAPTGRTRDAVAELHIAASLDPLSNSVATDLGRALYLDRRYDEALAAFDAVVTRDGGFREAHWQSGIVLAQMGRHQDATAAFDRALALEPSREGIAGTLGCARAVAGDTDAARAWLEKARTPGLSRRSTRRRTNVRAPSSG
jgi:serine/threonine-protein kinase